MSKTIGLKYQSRVLRPYPSTDKSAWIVATGSLREENEIRVVEFDEKSETLTSPFVYIHQNEVWDLALNPEAPETFVTTHNSGRQFAVSLLRAKEDSDQLIHLSEIGKFEKRIERVLWQDASSILSLEETRIRLWNVKDTDVKETACGEGQDLDQFSNMHMSTDQPQTLYVANGQGYQIWDLREMKKMHSVDYCHDMPLRNIDTASNYIATCADDCSVKIWDTRYLDAAMVELNGHSHWVWDCSINKKFPSLILSASSDSSVVLWNTDRIIKDAIPHSPRSVTGKETDALKACTYDDHDESVYCVYWSLVDEWTFASLSYDGRLVINKVPSDVKYGLLI